MSAISSSSALPEQELEPGTAEIASGGSISSHENVASKNEEAQDHPDGLQLQEEGVEDSATAPKVQAPGQRQRHCCLSHCFGFNKRTLGWISLMFLVVMILTTTLTTRNAYSSYSNSSSKDWILVGGITPTSATFRIRTDSERSRARHLVVFTETDDDGTANNHTRIHSTRNVPYDDYVATISVTDLESNTLYKYQTLSNNADEDSIDDGTGSVVSSGSFATPASGGSRFNFTIATAGCAWTASTSNVYTDIRTHDPLLFLHLGDFHYKDIDSDDVEIRIRAMDDVLSSPTAAALFQSTALAYMYDDHDWLGNNALGYQSGREAALQSYALGFPYYEPLPAAALSSSSSNQSNSNNNSSSQASSTAVSPYHAFTIGTVRFIIMDVRSEAVANGDIYSREQQSWLFGELRNSTRYDFVILVSTKPWIGPNKQGDDSWMGHPNDRTALSNAISQYVTNKNLLVISADAHMVAFDDGRNTYYGTTTATSNSSSNNNDTSATLSLSPLSFPILQSGPLDRLGSNKGGPFSDGCHTIRYERNHQYSTINFVFVGQEAEQQDANDKACMEITSFRVGNGKSSKRQVLFQKRLCGEIFASTDLAGTGSCDSPALSSGSIALLSISGALALACIVVTCYCFLENRCEATKIGVIVIVAFAVSLVAGFGIPLAMGISQFETFAILLVSLIQMFVTFIYLLAWSLKKRAGKV